MEVLPEVDVLCFGCEVVRRAVLGARLAAVPLERLDFADLKVRT
jgi:hypothetical protein